MNKRFFTLLAMLVMAVSFGTFAQEGITGKDPGKSFSASKFYLLQTKSGSYLAIDGETNGLITVSAANLYNYSYTQLQAALWQVTTKGGTGTLPATYSFKNAASEIVLALNESKAVEVGKEGDLKADANLLGGNIDPWIASTNSVKPGENFFYFVGKDDKVTTLAAYSYNGQQRIAPIIYSNLTALQNAVDGLGNVSDLQEALNNALIAWQAAQDKKTNATTVNAAVEATESEVATANTIVQAMDADDLETLAAGEDAIQVVKTFIDTNYGGLEIKDATAKSAVDEALAKLNAVIDAMDAVDPDALNDQIQAVKDVALAESLTNAIDAAITDATSAKTDADGEVAALNVFDGELTTADIAAKATAIADDATSAGNNATDLKNQVDALNSILERLLNVPASLSTDFETLMTAWNTYYDAVGQIDAGDITIATDAALTTLKNIGGFQTAYGTFNTAFTDAQTEASSTATDKDDILTAVGEVQSSFNSALVAIARMSAGSTTTIDAAKAALSDTKSKVEALEVLDADNNIIAALNDVFDAMDAVDTTIDLADQVQAVKDAADDAVSEVNTAATAVATYLSNATQAEINTKAAYNTAQANLAGVDKVLVITPQLPTGNIYLSPNDLNTQLGKTGIYDGANGFVAQKDSKFKLYIKPENTLDNPFTGDLQASSFTVGADKLTLKTDGYKDKTGGWVVLTVDENKNFIVVDTAFIKGTEQGNNGLIRTKTDRLYGYKDKTIDTKKRLAGSYIFRFLYDAENDGVVIESLEYISAPADKIWLGSPEREPAKRFFTYAELLSEVAYTFGYQDEDMVIRFTAAANYTPFRIPAGAYLLKRVSGYPEKDGQYLKFSLDGYGEWVAEAKRQNFQHVPAAQWILESTATNSVTITNREFACKPNETYYGNYYKNLLPGQGTTYSVKDHKDQFFFLGGDTIQFVPVKEADVATLGYKVVSENDYDVNRYQFRYLHELQMDRPIALKEGEEPVLYVNTEDKAQNFRLQPVLVDAYGYNGGLKGVAQLERSVYRIEVRDAFSEEGKVGYVAYSHDTKKYYLSDKKVLAVNFFLKENNEDIQDEKAVCYYVLVAANITSGDWSEINDKGELIGDVLEGGLVRDIDVVNKNYVLVSYDEDEKEWFAVDPADVDWNNADYYWVNLGDYVTHESDYRYASYKAAVDNNTLELVRGVLDDDSWSEVSNSTFKVEPDETVIYRTLVDEENNKVNDQLIKIYRSNSNPDHREYLYEDANSVYSVENGPNKPSEERTDINDQINFLGVEGKGDYKKASMHARYVRGTVMPQYVLMMGYNRQDGSEAKCPVCEGLDEPIPGCPHHESTAGFSTARVLVSLKDSVASGAEKDKNVFKWESYTRLAFVNAMFTDGATKKDSLLNILSSNIKDKMNEANKFEVKFKDAETTAAEGKHKPVFFSLRYVDETLSDFMIESDGPIAGDKNVYVKIHNGVPVLVETDFYSAVARQAEIFNLETTEENATSNEGISNGKYEVTAGVGTVTIKGAAGKQVIVVNILGKVVANVTLGSDYETISVPAGVVVVSVDGEATKALVK